MLLGLPSLSGNIHVSQGPIFIKYMNLIKMNTVFNLLSKFQLPI
jgi:hypothetical protein